MRKNVKKLLACILAATIIGAPVATSSAVQTSASASSMWESFENPPLSQKSRPLWFWNRNASDMTVEEIESIMENSKESGYYGFGILPENQSDYMSEDYFVKYGAALDKAAELGMKMCLYDENGYPSYTAGGRLAEQYPEHTAKRLDMFSEDFEGPVTRAKVSLPDNGTFMGAVAMNMDTMERIDVSEYAHIVTDTDPLGASASSTYSQAEGYDVSKAFDNDLTTRWNAASNSFGGQWLQVNYGEPTTFDKVYIKEELGRIRKHSVQYWDGEQWVDIVSGTTIDEKTYTFEPITATKIRLYMEEVVEDSASIWEFQIFSNDELVPIPQVDNSSYVQCDLPEGNWKLMGFMCVTDGSKGVDYLSAEAVSKFIEVAYQPYYDRFPEHFGTTIDMAFYDEPTFWDWNYPQYGVKGGRMWTGNFNELFEEEYGYSPVCNYPALFMDIGEDTAFVRTQMFGLRSELFARDYVGQVNEWCNEHNIKLTGHMLLEEWNNPTGLHGDLMKAFQYQDYPGVDVIGSYGYTQEAYKIVSSSAYNWDKNKVMTETFGAMGEGVSVDDLYRSAMDQYAKGINLIVPHAVWYDNSASEVTAPPELSYRSEKFGPELPALNEYFGRTSGLLQDGRHVADIAMLYPIYNLNSEFYFNGTACNPSDSDYMQVGEALSLNIRRDFTYLHPEVLDEKVTVDGDTLTLNNEVNYENYKVLILPSSKIMSVSNLEKVREFYENGGKVIATTKLPTQSVEEGRDQDIVNLVKEIFGVDPTASDVDPDSKVKLTASTTYSKDPGYEADKAGDGKVGTRWNAEALSGGDQWLEVDFGEEQTFDRIVIREALDRITSYDLQYWDGSEWVTFDSGDTIGSMKEITFEPVTAQKFRLYINTVTADSPSIAEIEAYAPDSTINLVTGKETSNVEHYTVQENGNGGKAYFIESNPTEYLEEVLDDANAVYDVEFADTQVSNGNLSYIHKVLDGSDIYFFANSSYTAVDTTVTLRGTLDSPAVWDPHTGERYRARYEYATENGEPVTKIHLTMPEVKSLFIVSDPDAPVVLYWDSFNAALEKAKAVDPSTVTASSAEVLQAAIDEAEELLISESVTQQQIDNCEELLNNALDQLEYYNLAYQKPVEASSSLERAPQFSLAGLTDGDYSSMYSSTSEDTVNHSEWIVIDLEDSYDIGKVNLVPRSDSPYEGLFYPIDYTIEVSNDMETWTTVQDLSGVDQPTTADPVEHVFDAVNARYVRITATNLRTHPGIDAYYRLQLSEVEVYRAEDEEPVDATVTVTDPESGEVITEVVKDGWFKVTVTTNDDVQDIRLFNEYGLSMVRKDYNITDNQDGSKTFTMLMNIGTVGQGRELTVRALDPQGGYSDTGLRVKLDVTAPVPELYSASIEETARVNVPVEVKVLTDKTVTRVNVYNENGIKMGTVDSSFEDTEEGREWTILIKIGTSGERSFSVTAQNKYGAVSEAMDAGTVTVTYF